MAGGWLSAIGRASPDIRKAMTDIEERPRRAERFQWESEQAAHQKAMYPLQEKETEQRVAIGGEHLKQETMETQQKQKEEERKKKPVSLMSGAFQDIVNADPEHGEKLKQFFKERGMNDAGQISQGDLEDAMMDMGKQEKYRTELMLPVVKGYQDKASSALQKYNEAKEKNPNDPKLPELWKGFKALDDKANQYSGFYSKIAEAGKAQKQMDDTIASLQADGTFGRLPTNVRAALSGAAKSGDKGTFEKILAEIGKPQKEITPSWKVVKDPNSKTGYSYQDMNDPKDVRPNAPAPKEVADVAKETRKEKLDHDKMYAQYNINRVTKQGKVKLSDILAKSFNITLDPEQEWPKFTREQFEKFITTGEMPNAVTKTTPQGQEEKWAIDAYKQGTPKDKVKSMYKTRTGKELPDSLLTK